MDKNQIIVAIEGIDGAGKTTLINAISQCFEGKVTIYKRTHKGNFIDKLVSSKIMQKHYMLQVPIYLILSYKNYILFRLKKKKEIVIMDRCFLSNICYFFPRAIWNNKLLYRLLLFEIKMFPQNIFILDVEPRTGRIRDANRKSLKWLEDTREAYINAANSDLTKWIKITVIQESLSIEEKKKIIINYIKGEMRNGN